MTGSGALDAGLPEPPSLPEPQASPPAAGNFQAVRAQGPLQVDGALTEDAWQRAPSFTHFVQSYPKVGAPPSERTEVWVLYDAETLYVGIRCDDSEPGALNASLALRDKADTSDLVRVSIDSLHDHRSGFRFGISAGGVLEDGLLFADNRYSSEWDGVWEGATRVDDKGWSAELAIPLRLLRFSSAHEQSWGFAVSRIVARSHEELDSVLLPRDLQARVSEFGHLEGLVGLRPTRAISITPYVAPRATRRPLPSGQFILDPALNLGADLTAAITSDLSLTAAINPDFGQVEADSLVLNFTSFEIFFPEKRPFFTEGMDLFAPVALETFSANQVFYSRRVGLEIPLLAAMKLSGSIAGDWRMAVVEAVEAGVEDPSKWEAVNEGGSVEDAALDRRVSLHPLRPLHLAPNDSLPAVPPAARNSLAVVARGPVASWATIGATVASSLPLSRRCARLPGATENGAELDLQPSCSPWGQHALALDMDLRFDDGAWAAIGQLDASMMSHGPEKGSTLQDGTVLRRGTPAVGAFIQGGRVGGEPWRFNIGYQYASPTHELNYTGYLKTQNAQTFRPSVQYVRPSGIGLLNELSVKLEGSLVLTTDGRHLPRESEAVLAVRTVWPEFTAVQLNLHAYPGGYLVREMTGSGLALERPLELGLSVVVDSDTNRLLSAGVVIYGGRTFTQGVAQPRVGLIADGFLRWSPHPQTNTELVAGLYAQPATPRWLYSEDERHVFGDLDGRSLTFTLRQLVVLTPKISLQLHAQLLTGYGSYGPFYSIPTASGASALRMVDLEREEEAADPSFDFASLNLTALLRYQYRRGSDIHLVYSHAQSLPSQGNSAPLLTLNPSRLFRGPPTDILLLKLSYRFDI